MYRTLTALIANNQIKLLCIGLLSLIIAFTYVDFLHQNYGGVVTSPRMYTQDTPSYIHAIELIAGESSGSEFYTYMQRLLTAPLMLLSSLGIGTLIGDYASGMLFVNVALYLISIPIFYALVQLVYPDTRIAFIASVLYITNWCLFSFGTTYLSDMGGWFFFILTTFFALKYYRAPNTKKWLIYGVISAIIGVFFKEYGGLGMISLALLILINSTLPLRRRLEEVVTAGGVFSLTLLAYHTWFYMQFGYSYFDWYGYNQDIYMGPDDEGEKISSLSTLVKVVGWIFHIGWPLFLIGLYYEWKNFRQGMRERAYILLALLPASLAFLAWPAFTQRVAFILVPLVAMVSAFGISKISSRKVAFICIILYVVLNYHVGILMLRINMPF